MELNSKAIQELIGQNAAKGVLRVYVWPWWAPDWTNGLAFAVACSENEAREMIIKENTFDPPTWGPCQVFDIVEKPAFCVYGGG